MEDNFCALFEGNHKHHLSEVPQGSMWVRTESVPIVTGFHMSATEQPYKSKAPPGQYAYHGMYRQLTQPVYNEVIYVGLTCMVVEECMWS